MLTLYSVSTHQLVQKNSFWPRNKREILRLTNVHFFSAADHLLAVLLISQCNAVSLTASW